MTGRRDLDPTPDSPDVPHGPEGPPVADDFEHLTPRRPRKLKLGDRAHWTWMLHDLARTTAAAAELRQIQGPYTPPQASRVRRYNAALGPFETREGVLVDRETLRLLDMNEMPLGGSECLGLESGAPGVGKSTNIGTALLLRSAEKWLSEGQRTDEGHEYWPYAYLEANSSMRGAGLLRAMLGFFTPIVDPRANFDTLLKQLANMIDKVGNVLFVIDDAHHLRQTDESTATLTNHLKTIVTSVPTSLVFVGNDLEDSALLKPTRRGAHTAAEQIRARMRRVRYPRYTTEPKDGHLPAFTDVMRKLEANLVIGDHDLDGVLTASDTVNYLVEGSSGRLGIAIKWIKDAAADAISKGEPLTPELMENTRPDDFEYHGDWSAPARRSTT